MTDVILSADSPAYSAVRRRQHRPARGPPALRPCRPARPEHRGGADL